MEELHTRPKRSEENRDGHHESCVQFADEGQHSNEGRTEANIVTYVNIKLHGRQRQRVSTSVYVQAQ
jgi:hypothetical protein